MKTKKCTNKNCEQPIKPLSEFHKCKKHPDGYAYWCKKCMKKYLKKYFRNNPKQTEKIKQWIIKNHKKYPWKRTLRDIIVRCNNPKHKSYKNYGGKGIKCQITEEELKELWFRNEADKMNRPSIHRKNSNKNYYVENCEYIELRKNVEYAHSKGILQYDFKGNFLGEYDSVVKASKETNENYSNIINYLNSKYIWKYK